MKEIKSHKDLELYKESKLLVIMVYKLTESLPDSEKFGLVSQMRRAAISIPSNIAEGAARKNTKEFIQFLYHSLGSASELETQIDICKDLNFIDDINEVNDKLHYVINMLLRLIKTLKSKNT